MKKRLKYLILLVLIVGPLFTYVVLADLPPDPGGGGPGGGDLPVGGGSPIGGGLLTLLMAGITYGIYKFSLFRKKEL